MYEFLCDVLPRDLHVLFQMYHMKTEETLKKNILNSFMDTNGHVRIVLCSTSFSMGLDLRDVPYVVHYGPSNDLSSYLQETGRCAWDQSIQGQAVLLKYPRCLSSSNITGEMKEYMKTRGCR